MQPQEPLQSGFGAQLSPLWNRPQGLVNGLSAFDSASTWEVRFDSGYEASVDVDDLPVNTFEVSGELSSENAPADLDNWASLAAGPGDLAGLFNEEHHKVGSSREIRANVLTGESMLIHALDPEGLVS